MADIESSVGQSLLDVILDKVSKSGKGVMISRITIVGRLARRTPTVKSVQASMINTIRRQSLYGEITGMVLVYPIVYVVVFEAKTTAILSIVKDLIANDTDIRLAETRVVSFTEDVPDRIFKNFYASYVSSNSNVEIMDAFEAMGAVKAAADLGKFFRRVGPLLRSPDDMETQQLLATLESYIDEIPPLEVVLSFCPTEDAPSLKEFLNIFTEPVNIDLESDRVWPMPPRLTY